MNEPTVLEWLEKETQNNQNKVLEDLKRLVEEAWCSGITIKEVSLQDNFVTPPGGSLFERHRIPAPELSELETDYGVVKVSSFQEQEEQTPPKIEPLTQEILDITWVKADGHEKLQPVAGIASISIMRKTVNQLIEVVNQLASK